MPPRTAGTRSLARNLQDLAKVEFRTTADVAFYAASIRAIGGQYALEIHVGATELEKRLAEATPTAGGMDRFTARRTAKRAVKRLRRAAEDFADAADDSARFWRDFLRIYGDLINPQRRKSSQFKFEDK
jgi:hypothetical protein